MRKWHTCLLLVFIVYFEKKIGVRKLSCGFKWSKTGTKRQSARTLQVSQQSIRGGGGREACAVSTGAGKAAGRVSAWLQRSRHHGLIEHQARSSLGWLGPGSRVKSWIKAKGLSRTHSPSQIQTCNEICPPPPCCVCGQNGKCRA